MQKRAYFLVFAAMFALGCGGDINDLLPSRGSCNVPAGGLCTDYVGTAWSTPSSGERACAQVGTGATYYTGACNTANRVGTCRVQAGTASEIAFRYFSSRFTVTVAAQACSQSSGQFTAN